MQYGMSSLRESPAGPDPLRKKKPTEPGASDSGAPSAAASGIRQPAGQPGSQPAPMSQAPTFAQLQSQGIARPAPPPMMAPGGMTQAPGAQGPEAAVNQILGYGASPGAQAPMFDQTSTRSFDPSGPGAGGPTQTPTAPPRNNGSPLDADLTSQILGWLNNPQGYSSDAFNADVTNAYNGIDDEYALNQKSLADNLASRGLGTSGDSSIGLGRLSDLNVGRKSAKETVLGQLSSDREKRFSADLKGAIDSALGYNQQLYGHDYLGKQINMQGMQSVLQALVQSGGMDEALVPQFLQVLSAMGFGAGGDASGRSAGYDPTGQLPGG